MIIDTPLTMLLIQSPIMSLPRWDRIYYFVFLAEIFAAVSYVIILAGPLIEIVNPTNDVTAHRTLLADGQIGLVLMSLIPLAICASSLVAVPRDGIPDRAAKINLWMSTILIYVFIVLFGFTNGILFIPSGIMMTAAAVASQIRRRVPRARSRR
jgi:hypothetical protein